jgi:hypothetical protein
MILNPISSIFEVRVCSDDIVHVMSCHDFIFVVVLLQRNTSRWPTNMAAAPSNFWIVYVDCLSILDLHWVLP